MTNLDNNNWHVYALFSIKYDRIYIGMSERPEERLKEHNAGKTKSTKAFRPWVKIYLEFVGSRIKAREREKYLKSGVGREFIRNFIPKKNL